MQPINDPAPSRVSYRMQRLWLTPTFRFFARKILPVLVFAAVTLLIFTSEAVITSMQSTYASARDMIEDRPEFEVKTTRVTGASGATQSAIVGAMALSLPQSSFDLDFESLTAAIKALDAVEEVNLHIKERGVMDIEVTEREASLIWRGPEGLMLLDNKGQTVARLELRGERPDLPLIAGHGVPNATAEALDLLEMAKPLQDRIRGLVRKGERRWDLVLDRGQRILLPEQGARTALTRVLTLHRTADILARDITVLDVRNPKRVTVRIPQGAIKNLRDLQLASQKKDL